MPDLMKQLEVCRLSARGLQTSLRYLWCLSRGLLKREGQEAVETAGKAVAAAIVSLEGLKARLGGNAPTKLANGRRNR